MSEPPAGGADFFGRIPFFREFARLLAGSGGPVNWELARQVAVATAAGAEVFGAVPALPDPSSRTPDPAEARRWEEQLRLAELWLEPATTLPGGDVAVSAQPRSRLDWAEWALTGLPPLVEPAARRMATALASGPETAGELGAMVERIGGLLFGVQLGMTMGQLARSVVGHYEITLPMADPAHLVVLPENMAALEQGGDLPADQLRLCIAARQLVRQRVLERVDWVRVHLTSLIEAIAAAMDPDPGAIADRLQSLDMANPESLQELLERGDLLAGSRSPALLDAVGRLETFLALADGYAEVVSQRALEGRLPALEAIQRELRRRAEAPDGPPVLFAAMLQADPKRAAGRRGEAFCREVLAATDGERLDRVWSHPNFLPSPDEMDQPGRWLERMGLIGGEPVDLDEGLRELLEGGEEPDSG